MTIISSQHFLNWEIVENKMEELEGINKVVIPCSYVGVIDGVEYAMQNNAHHTLAAARELGIEVEFYVAPDSEGLEGEELLEQRYNDGDWYNVEKSDPSCEKFDFIW